MSIVVDPSVWKYMAHGDETAWLDFAGFHHLLHQEYAVAIRQLGGAPYPILPLSPTPRSSWLQGPQPRTPFDFYPDDDWMSAHQIVSDGEAASLLVAAAPDLRSYDFLEAEQFASWALLHAQEMTRIRQAIGI